MTLPAVVASCFFCDRILRLPDTYLVGGRCSCRECRDYVNAYTAQGCSR